MIANNSPQPLHHFVSLVATLDVQASTLGNIIEVRVQRADQYVLVFSFIRGIVTIGPRQFLAQ